jgi:hypothetical protein
LYSPEIQVQIAIWRAKALEGTLTVEELKQSTAILREGRVSAATASTSARRKKAKAVILNVEELERELGIG